MSRDDRGDEPINKRKNKDMKTITKQDVLNNMGDKTGKVMAKEVDYANKKTGIKLFLPELDWVRTWPESALETLVTLAGRQALQHGCSTAVRSALDFNDDPKRKEDKQPLKDIPDVFFLAEECAKEVVNKALVKKAEAMLDKVKKGGDAVWGKFVAGAATYGFEGLPAKWEELKLSECIEYQQAKAGYIGDLA